jgi:hypothetical protein
MDWDIKTLKVYPYGDQDENTFLKFELFDGERFSIYVGERDDAPQWHAEEMSLNVAKRIRDFLTYAIAAAEENRPHFTSPASTPQPDQSHSR